MLAAVAALTPLAERLHVAGADWTGVSTIGAVDGLESALSAHRAQWAEVEALVSAHDCLVAGETATIQRAVDVSRQRCDALLLEVFSALRADLVTALRDGGAGAVGAGRRALRQGMAGGLCESAERFNSFARTMQGPARHCPPVAPLTELLRGRAAVVAAGIVSGRVISVLSGESLTGAAAEIASFCAAQPKIIRAAQESCARRLFVQLVCSGAHALSTADVAVRVTTSPAACGCLWLRYAAPCTVQC